MDRRILPPFPFASLTRLATTLVCLSLLAVPALAQAVSARLSGVVQDTTQALIPGVEVHAINTETNTIFQAFSSESGRYTFANLPPGNYSIRAELPGFKKVVVEDLKLQVGDAKTLNLTLQPGEITESITVTAEAALIDVSTTKIGAVVENRQAVDLPLNGRDAMMLFYLQAGTNPLDRAGGSGSQQQQGVVDGLAPHTSAIKVEGIMSSNPGYDYSPSHPSTPVPQEAVGEYRVTTSQDSVSSGRGSGAQVKVLLKSGTNEFHGSLFEFNRNTSYNANDFFNNRTGTERPVLRRHQFGFSVGGPIWKDRTFFFTTVELQRQTEDSIENRLVYTPTLREGIFRFYKRGRNSGSLVDSGGNPTVSAEDIGTINLVQVDPTRLGFDTFWLPVLLAAQPAPNNFDIGDGFNVAGFRYNSPRAEDVDQYMFKVDHALTQTHSLAFSYSNLELNNPQAALINGISPENFIETRRGGSLRLVSSLSAQLTNELSVGANLRRAQRPITNPDQEQPRGNIQFEGIGGGSGLTGTENGNLHILRGTQDNPAVNMGFSDTVSWVSGSHSFDLGGEYWYQTLNRKIGFGHWPVSSTLNAANPANIPAIAGLDTADRNRAAQLTNDLTGSIGTVDQTFFLTNPVELLPFTNLYQATRKVEWSLFISDVWNIRPGLTLTLGLRYEVLPPLWIDNVFGYPIDGVAGALGIQGPTSQPTRWGQAPNEGRDIYQRDTNNFAPHLGFTWDPAGDGKTAISGSYRLAYDRFMIATLAGFSDRNFGTSTQVVLNPFARLSDSDYFTGGVLPIPVPPIFPDLGFTRESTVYVADPNIASPYVQSWSLGIERQLFHNWKLDAAYVGNHAVGMLRGADFNQVDIFDNGFLDAFLIAKQNLAANGNPNVGQSVGALQPLFSLIPSSQFRLLEQDQVATLANFLDTTTLLTGVRGGLLGLAGLPNTFFRFNPQVDDLVIVGNRSHSTWHGLKLSVNRQLSGGLYFQGNYTFSKGLTDSVPGQNLADPFRDNRNHKLDKALSPLDSTHVFQLNGILELPFGRGKRFLSSAPGFVDVVLGGWQFNSIFDFTTGRPFTIVTGRNMVNQDQASTPDFSGNFENLAEVHKGDVITVLPGNMTAAFSNPGPGEAGGLPLQKFHGPNYTTLDMSLFKKFRLPFVTEDSELQFRIEFFNVLNRVSFRPPASFTSTSGNFGLLSRVWPARIGQFALKFVF